MLAPTELPPVNFYFLSISMNQQRKHSCMCIIFKSRRKGEERGKTYDDRADEFGCIYIPEDIMQRF